MLMDDFKKSLPDSYNKQSGSNNDKILQLEQAIVKTFREDLQAVNDALDINNASGETLDLFGELVGQGRGGLNDAQYRAVILSAVARNACQGTHSSIVELLAVAFNCDITKFNLTDGAQPAFAELNDMPYSVFLESGLTVKQVYQIVNSMLPAGVRLGDLQIDGTFEFSATDNEYDELAGFGNVEQTIGGYFGLLASDEHNIPS